MHQHNVCKKTANGETSSACAFVAGKCLVKVARGQKPWSRTELLSDLETSVSEFAASGFADGLEPEAHLHQLMASQPELFLGWNYQDQPCVAEVSDLEKLLLSYPEAAWIATAPPLSTTLSSGVTHVGDSFFIGAQAGYFYSQDSHPKKTSGSGLSIAVTSSAHAMAHWVMGECGMLADLGCWRCLSLCGIVKGPSARSADAIVGKRGLGSCGLGSQQKKHKADAQSPHGASSSVDATAHVSVQVPVLDVSDELHQAFILDEPCEVPARRALLGQPGVEMSAEGIADG